MYMNSENFSTTAIVLAVLITCGGKLLNAETDVIFFFKLRDSGNFGKALKIRVKLILICPQAHAITCTNYHLPD